MAVEARVDAETISLTTETTWSAADVHVATEADEVMGIKTELVANFDLDTGAETYMTCQQLKAVWSIPISWITIYSNEDGLLPNKYNLPSQSMCQYKTFVETANGSL